jgi:serine/threonine-protein kinase
MADVFEGRHTQLGSRAALKVMKPSLAAQPLAAARFLREAVVASKIRHPNVVEVFDIGTENGLPFIVMEYLEGSNLATLLDEKGPLSLTAMTDVFLPIISAVATAHAVGVIHRDLKPANVMITRRPPRGAHPMVVDFGISKIATEEPGVSFTRAETLLGTVEYMAPEVTRGAKFASAKSDQYAIGVMLYECATGRRPFSGASDYDLMHAIVTAPVHPPSHFQPTLPPEFDAAVLRAMHRDPAKRFPTVADLGSALLSFGDRTAWALWESEFTPNEPEGEPWAVSQRTLHDRSSTGECSREVRRHPAAVAAAPHRRWIVLALSVCAVLAFLANRVTARGLIAGAPSAAPVVGEGLDVGPFSPISGRSEAEPPVTSHATPVTLRDDNDELAGRGAPMPLTAEPIANRVPPVSGLSAARSSANSAKPSPPTARLPDGPSSTAPRSVSSGDTARARSMSVGTNGALIVE